MSMDTIATQQPKRFETGQFHTESGAELSLDAVVVGQALEEYKRKYRRPFPTVSQMVELFHRLGYRRIAPAEPL